MAASRRNVDLVIRARDEGTKAFEAAVRALQSLNAAGDGVAGSATEASSRLQQLVTVATTVDRAFSQISAGADQATASIQRQKAAIAEQQAQLAALKGQSEAAAQAIARIQTAIVDRVLAGGDTSGLVTQLQAARAAAASFDKEAEKLSGSIERQQAAIAGSRSTLQQLGSTTVAAESAQTQLTAQIAAETAAMEQQALAAGRLSQAERERLSAARAAGDNDAVVAILKEVEARDRNIAKLKAEQQAATELAQIKEAQARAATLLPGDATTGLSARDSASVFDAAFRDGLEDSEGLLRANAQATKDMEAAAQRLRNQLNPLQAIEDRLNKELAEANALYKAGKISATELGQATLLLKANAQGAADALGRQSAGIGKPRLFGLKPYEVQNLSFQINDVFTQLASGTSVTQTLAQQGGQLLQIFPKIGSAIIKAFTNPAVLAFAGAVTLVVLAFKRAGDEAARLRELEGAIAAAGERAGVTAESLGEAADEMDRFGLSAKDAVEAVKIFNKEAINPDRIVQFGRAVQDYAEILKKEIPEAAEDVAKAFNGGVDAILKLDDAFDFLNATERQRVRDLAAEVGIQEARTFAFEKFRVKVADVSAEVRSQVRPVEALGTAWSTFIDVLGDSKVINEVGKGLTDFGVQVTSLLNRLANARSIRDIDSEIGVFQRRIEELNRTADYDPFGFKAQQIDEYRERIQKLVKEREKLLEQDKDLAGAPVITPLTEAEIEAARKLGALNDERLTKNENASRAERIAAAERIATAEALDFLGKERLSDLTTEAQLAEVAFRKAEARRQVEEQITREKEKQRREEEQAIKGFSQKVIGVESGGDANAKNPLSTATGLGQFIESTWLDLFKRHFPDRAKELSDGAILALRRDSEISKKLIEVYARENAEVLKKAGQSVTEANLFLTHFLGPEGAVKILRAAASTPVSKLLSPEAIAANRSVLQGKTAGEVRQFATDRFDDGSLAAIADVQARLNEIKKEQADSQSKFNAELDAEQARLQRSIEQYDARKGLIGEALIAVERQQAIDDAIFQKEQDLKKTNEDRLRQGKEALVLGEQEKKQLAELVGLEFDRANARRLADAQRTKVQQPVDDLTALRNELQQQIEFLRGEGLTSQADELTKQLDAVNERLREAIELNRQFWIDVLNGAHGGVEAFGLTEQQVKNLILGLDTAKLSTQTLGTFMGVDLKQAAQRFAQGATTAFDRFAQGIAEGKNVITSLKDAFLQFAADFLRQIAQMIIQQYAYNFALLIARMLGGGPAPGAGAPTGGGGSVPGFGPGFSLHHQGGVAGEDNVPTRVIDPAWFKNALRYHGGGIAGLRPGEVPAILKRGEEVLTEDDPRHIANGGAGGPSSVKVVNLFNPADVLSEGLSDQVGEKVFFSFVRRNRDAFQAALGK